MNSESIQMLLELTIAFLIACTYYYVKDWRRKNKQKAPTGNKLYKYPCMSNTRLEKAWRNMEEKNVEISPFLYFDYMKYIFQCTARKLSVLPMIICVESPSGEILMIAPVKKYLFSNKLKMLGDVQGCGHTGFLFKPDLSEEEITKCISLFVSQYGKKLCLNRIDEKSWLHTYFTRQERKGIESSEWPCIRITFTEDIDRCIKGLSASVRQNLRTAYNRMGRNGIGYKLKIWMPQDVMTAQDRKEIKRIYLQRLLSKYKNHKVGNFFYRSYKTIYYNHIKHDSRSLYQSRNSFHAALFEREKCICFMSGFANHEETSVVIPRLAINNEYRFYSPGYILICETMKWLASYSQIREIDLTRGTEKYKTDLGGKLYHTYSYFADQSH